VYVSPTNHCEGYLLKWNNPNEANINGITKDNDNIFSLNLSG